MGDFYCGNVIGFCVYGGCFVWVLCGLVVFGCLFFVCVLVFDGVYFVDLKKKL